MKDNNKYKVYVGYIPGSRIGHRKKRHLTCSIDERTAMNLGNYIDKEEETLSDVISESIRYYLEDRGEWVDYVIDIEEEIY